MHDCNFDLLVGLGVGVDIFFVYTDGKLDSDFNVIEHRAISCESAVLPDARVSTAK